MGHEVVGFALGRGVSHLCGEVEQSPFERPDHVVDLHLIRVPRDEAGETVGDPHGRKRFGHEKPIPASGPPGGSDSDPHREKWKARHTCDGQGTQLELTIRALGAVGRNGEISSGASRSDESPESPYATASARAPYRPEAEVLNDPGEVFPVTMFTHQNHGAIVAMDVDERQQSSMPEDENDGPTGFLEFSETVLAGRLNA